MRKGELVPDATVLDLVRERSDCLRCAGGFLLDGFPRTVAQAEALAGLLVELDVKLDAVVNFCLPIQEIVARLSGRRTCSGCKSVFHVTGRPSKVEGVCDHCGGQLIQREDDRPASVRVRMEAYERSTAPLTDYFQKQGLLIQVDAHGPPEEIFQRTLRLLGAGS
jgi:adenylate kinase